jgi:TolB-like protein
VAESLATRLTGVQGLQARVAQSGEASGADFIVRGDIAARDGRLVIATRLHQADRDEVLWTATFWRKDSVDSDLVGDLAAGLAEAIYGQLAREAVTAKRRKP